jgi:myo-inositol-1(or 4)-monophosphatase
MTYHERVLPVMKDTRDMLRKDWGVARAVNQKSDSAWSVVTQLDLDVESRVSRELASLFPDIVFVGEEYGGDRTAKKFWLMDPIDGTAHYMRGLPFCTSMLALIDEGAVVFSAIYDFLNDRMYWAEKGRGAFCNDEKLRVSERRLREAFVSFETNIDRPANAVLRSKLREKTDLVSTFSAGWEFAMVASGKLEARICFDPYGNDYDFAPGTLLVAEAGGMVANIGSSSFDYRNLNFIAANKTVYGELTEDVGAIFPVR